MYEWDGLICRLNKQDLVNLIKGAGPGSWESMGVITEKGFGQQGYGALGSDESCSWHWYESKMLNASEQELWDLYEQLKREKMT